MVGEEAPRHRLGASGLRWVDVEGLGVRAELWYAERERGREVRGARGRRPEEEEAAKQGGGGRGAWPRAPGACPSSWQRRKATAG